MTIYTIRLTSPTLLIILIIGAIINTYYYLNIIFNFSLANINFKNNNFSKFSNKNTFTTTISIISLSLFPTFYTWNLQIRTFCQRISLCWSRFNKLVHKYCSSTHPTADTHTRAKDITISTLQLGKSCNNLSDPSFYNYEF